jgi:catechol 2,3-dioxygenase-like lactoylglutathione lyase family enzyme
MTAAHVHSLLHCNLNSHDLHKAVPFYERALGQSIGMRTTRSQTEGAALGVEGNPTTEVFFLYDHRGPRSAPAVEMMDWVDPAALGDAPAEDNHLGLAAIGYAVPSLDAALVAVGEIGAPEGDTVTWPFRDGPTTFVRQRDLDGVVVELVEADVPAPQFSHLRITVRDLDAAIAWYARIGFALQHRHEGTPAVASLQAEGDPSLSVELTTWPTVVGAPITPAFHVGLYRIALAVDDVQAAAAELGDAPEPIWVPLPGTRLGGVTVLFLTDPDGLVVELVERPRAAMTGRAQAS